MAIMDPRNLIPREVLAPLTPLGRKPLNRWVQYGPGGDPYEPRGLFPTQPGENRLAPGYDGLDADHAPLLWQRAESRAIHVPDRPRMTYATQQRASAPMPRKSTKRGRLVAPLVPLADVQEAPRQDNSLLFLLLGAGVGVAAAYILYDETLGTGARLRRMR